MQIESDLEEVLEEMNCGFADPEVLRRWLLETASELTSQNGNRWAVAPPLGLETEWTDASLIPRNLVVSSRGVFIPVHFSCVDEGCEAASRPVYDCPAGFDFNEADGLCHARYFASCISGSYREDIPKVLSSPQFPGISFI